MSMEAINLTEKQIQDALQEIEATDITDDMALKELDDCENNLHNLELEEQDLSLVNKSKSLQSFAITSKHNDKLPLASAIKRRKTNVRRALTLSGNSDILVSLVLKDTKTYIINTMIQPYKEAVDKLELLINEKIELLLNALIPRRLRADRANFGRRPFVNHPGFFWICGNTHNNLKFWVQPDIIYYFEQHTEMDYLHKAYPETRLRRVDSLIERYLKAVKKLATRTSTLKLKLTYVDTYDDLINFNIDLAEELIEAVLKERKQPTLAELIKGGNIV